jgi:hypothetical protein
MTKAKMFLIVAAAGLAGLGLLATHAGLLQQRGAADVRAAARVDESMAAANESPIACNLGAFNPAQLRHKEELGSRLWASVQETRELPDGYAFRLPADSASLQTVGEWVGLERMCCPFFSFGVEAEREGGPVWLRLTGREGVKQFIRAELPRVLRDKT